MVKFEGLFLGFPKEYFQMSVSLYYSQTNRHPFKYLQLHVL